MAAPAGSYTTCTSTASRQRHLVQYRRQRRRQRPPPACSCTAASAQQPRVTLFDAHDLQIPYKQAWDWQKRMVEAVACASATTASDTPASASRSGSSSHSNTIGSLVLLQHPPVYTLGTGATEGHLKFDPAESPLPLYRTERGGEVRQTTTKGCRG